MASTAATLEILVNARTQSASSSLRRMDQSARTSAGHLSNLDRTSGRLTSTLSRVGEAAVGAAAGYIGLSAAKNAISATSDLAKTTLSLNRNMGFSIKTASELGANLKIRGSDAKAAQMAFATFAGVLHQAGDGSASAAAKLQELGISGKRLKSDLKDPQQALFDVSDGLKNLGAGIKRTDDTRKLFGRGWSALSPILRGGAADLKKNLDLADQMGASFSNLGIKNMQDFIDAQHQAELGMLGLQIGFTQTLGPVLIGAMNQFSGLARSIHQKGFVDAISNAISGMANRAGQMAPKVLSALVQGFANASIAGKLSLAGILIAKFGGLSAFGKFGKGAGRTWGLAFLAGVLGVELVKQIIQIIHGNPLQSTKSESLSTSLHQNLPNISIGSPTIGRQGVTLNTQMGRLIFNPDTGKVIKASTDKLKALVGKSADEVQAVLTQKFGGGGSGHVSAAAAWSKELGSLQGITHSSLGKLLGITKQDIGTMRQAVSQGFDWRDVVTGRLNSWINVIKQKVTSGKITVQQGTQAINQVMLQELQVFGAGTAASGGKTTSAGTPNIVNLLGGKQRGGAMVPGSGSGDIVPALLEPGEFVLNREAVAAIGLPNLDKMNHDVPRFAGGGKIPSFSPANRSPISLIASDALNVEAQAARRALARARRAATPTGGGTRQGPSGHGTFMGVPMANWVIQSLQYAASKGASPQPTAGWAPGTGHAPGSQHYLDQYPGGAVDYGWPVDPAALVKKNSVVQATRNFKWPLLAPIGFRDDGHASGTGHMLGGLIKRFQGGGFMPPAPSSSRYDSFYGFDSWAEPKDYPHQLSVGSWKGLLAHYAKAVGLDPGKLVSLHGDPKKDPRAWFNKWRVARPPYQKGGLIRRFASGGGVSPSHPAHGTHWLSPHNPVNANEGATLLWQAGMRPGDASNLSSVLPDESGGRWTARNPSSGATGIWQILGSVYPGNLTNPVINSINAAIKWRTQGSGAWPTYPGSGPHGRIMQAAVAGSTTAAVKTPKTGTTATTATPSALSGSDLADVNADAINAFLIANGIMPPAPTIDPSTGEATGSGTIVGDFRTQAQDAIDSYNQHLTDINDLLTSGNTEALQRYQVAASQYGVLGLGTPNSPALYNMNPLLDIDSAAGQAYLQSIGLLAPQNIITASPYGQSITIGGGSNFVTGSSLTAIKQRGGLISYDNGGVVPGPVGSPQMAVVHGGEEITPPGHGGSHVHLHFKPGTEWLRDFVDVRVEKELKQKSRRGRRKLPSAGA